MSGLSSLGMAEHDAKQAALAKRYNKWYAKLRSLEDEITELAAEGMSVYDPKFVRLLADCANAEHMCAHLKDRFFFGGKD